MLESLVRTDALTGLANRRSFEERIAREWQRWLRDRQPLSVLMIDADHFKAYNDRYGHLAGDGLLQQLAAVIAGATRRQLDLAARYGGEEFVILLPGTDVAGAQAVAAFLLQSLRESNLCHPANASGRVSVSIGIACSTQLASTSYRDLIRAADTALFEAKAGGRNQARLTAAERTRAPDGPSERADDHTPSFAA